MMKFALLVGDGMADFPLVELQGRTPLQAANTPFMDRLACEGTVGLVRTIPNGMAAGSDIANLNLLGYDVKKYYSGRAPLEAASRGIELSDSEVAFRCNLVTVTDDTMRDYSAGHIGNEEAAELIAAIEKEMGGPAFRFYSGVSYRHLLVTQPDKEKRWECELECTPPHDIVGQPIEKHMPRGEDAGVFRKLMVDSVRVLAGHPVNRRRLEAGKKPANMIWLWGQGKRPSMPDFSELYGMTGAVISAVDLIRGIGRYAGLSIIEVPGATGYFDTNYAGKGSYGLRALDGGDFLFVHVEAPDEAGHVGNIEEKIRAIENFDRFIVGPIAEGISQSGQYRVMVLPDHYTPISVGTHIDNPVPYVVWGTGISKGNATCFCEDEAAKSGILFKEGFELLPYYLRKRN